MPKEDQRAGLLYALAGFTLLSSGDAVIKSMADLWPPIAVAALRFSIAAIALSAILWAKEGRAAFRPQKPWLQLVRGLALAGATACFFSAIFVMPLAETTALVFVSPFFVAMLSGPLLNEKPVWQTYLVSAIAFVGVLMILRPNLAAIGPAAVLPIFAALFMAIMVIANRAVAGQGSSLSMQAFVAMVAAPVLTMLAFIGKASPIEALHFGWPEPQVVLRCTVVAVSATCAHWLIYIGTTKASAALVAPMSYVQILVAIVLGWLLFGDWPDALTIVGSAIIIGAGLVLWRISGKGRAKNGNEGSRPST